MAPMSTHHGEETNYALRKQKPAIHVQLDRCKRDVRESVKSQECVMECDWVKEDWRATMDGGR